MASFKQNAKGKWYFVIDVPSDDILGKRKQKTFSKDDKGRPFESENKARAYCEKIEEQIERGRKFDSVLFGDYMKEYFERVVAETVSEVTYDHHWRMARLHILPYLGKKKLDKVNDEVIERLYDKLEEDGRSRAVISMVRTVLSKFFRFALKKRKIVENPMKLVTTPQYNPTVKQVWTPEQVDHFLECSKKSKFYTLYIVAESTGMRRGELLSLKWSDIDLDNGKITINKSLKFSTRSRKHVGAAKTENSRRTITVPQYTIDALRSYKETQIAGVEVVFDNFGEYYSTTHLSDVFKRDAESSGLPHNTIHGLRHAHASYLLSKGFSAADVAARLGDTKETIMKTYAHVLPNTQNEIASVLDRRKSVDKIES